MTLEESEKTVTEEVRNFFQNWRDEMQANPDEFPGEMPEPDWWEQLVSSLN